MIEWWNNIDLVGQIFALIAIPSTLVLVVQTVLLFFGFGDDDVDIDGDGLDADIEGGDGMALFSIRGIMGMAAVGGWSGLVMHEAGINIWVTILLAVAFGFLALVGIAYIMKLASKLQASGNIDLGRAVGRVGTVYIPIPPNMQGTGKINITLQERFLEVTAMTNADRKIATGESVRIVATDENSVVVVEPIK
ncbi:MAG: hypothetical protein E7627_07995 [Ruminococcaceae bacterium]|nr:hypothetical protein [Oscillospiraceae bacterium]